MAFKHYNGLKIIAAVGVIVAVVSPMLAKYLAQDEIGALSLLKLSAILLVTALIIVLFLWLIMFFLTRGTGTREERAKREQEERCVNLRKQALAACRCASEETKGYQKTWKKPKNTVVQETIWGTHPVENPKLFEILLTAREAGERDTELVVHPDAILKKFKSQGLTALSSCQPVSSNIQLTRYF